MSHTMVQNAALFMQAFILSLSNTEYANGVIEETGAKSKEAVFEAFARWSFIAAEALEKERLRRVVGVDA